ncbi:MAG TPA: CHAD domain-containing protein [Microlunatus sp.]
MADKSAAVSDLVGAYLVEQCTVLIEAEALLRGREPVIHSTRVAARRLRSTLRTYKQTADAGRAEMLAAELAWFAGLLGEVRDREVLEARLLADLAELPPELVIGPIAAQIETELTTARKAAWDIVIETLDSDRYRLLLADLHRWRSEPPLTEDAEAPAAKVTAYVKRATRKLDKRLDRAIEARLAGDSDADHLLHQARKAGKRGRYAVELAEPVLGNKADKIINARKALQDVLGEYQDSFMAADFLRTQGVRLGIRSGHNGFTYGLLYGRELARQDSVGERLKPFLT